MKKVMVMMLVVLFAAGSVMAFQGNGERNDRPMKGDRSGMSEKREEMAEFRDKIYETHKELIDKNRDALKKIGLEIEKSMIEFKEEMLKDNPDWKNVEKIMKGIKVNRDRIYEIKMDEKLTILKSLSKEDRDKVGGFLMKMGDKDRGPHGGRKEKGR